MKRLLFLTFFFAVGVLFSIFQYRWEESAREAKEISSDFYRFELLAKPGDMIVINSNNFMSNLFKEMDGCDHSSFKVVVMHDGQKLMMVSDIDSLSDDEGFYLSDMQGFFSDYDSVQISLWRPKHLTEQMRQNIERLKMDALTNRIPYDFAYNYRSDEGMSCIKLVQHAYGIEIFNPRNFKKAPYFNPLMCDVKLDQYFDLIVPMFSFWKK